MSYLEWLNLHAKKHKKIVDRLENLSDDEIIDYFKWENISKSDADFCPLFKEGKKCHDMKDLNCYLCACPNFRFDDEALKIKSFCRIGSDDGRRVRFGGVVHQDCSGCLIPHKKEYIKRVFSRDFKEMFDKCYKIS